MPSSESRSKRADFLVGGEVPGIVLRLDELGAPRHESGDLVERRKRSVQACTRGERRHRNERQARGRVVERRGRGRGMAGAEPFEDLQTGRVFQVEG